MLTAFIAGILFALIAQSVRLNTFDKIVDTLLLKSHDVAQILLIAIAISSVGFYVVNLFGVAPIDVKPFNVTGVVLGGTLFGIGVAILGYCPGTLAMALAEGRLDALFGMVGGLAAGLIFTLIYPEISSMIGPNFGELTLYASNPIATAGIVGLYAALLFGVAAKLKPK